MNNTESEVVNISKRFDEQLDAIFSYIRGILFFYGFATNLFVILVCLQPNLKTVPNFFNYSVISAFSLFHLVLVTLPKFVYQLAGLSQNLAVCRMHAFFKMFTLQITAFLIAFYVFEMYSNVRDPNFRKKYPVIKIFVWYSAIVSVLFIFLNSSAWFIVPKPQTNSTSEMVCMVMPNNTNSYFLTDVSIVIIIF